MPFGIVQTTRCGTLAVSDAVNHCANIVTAMKRDSQHKSYNNTDTSSLLCGLRNHAIHKEYHGIDNQGPYNSVSCKIMVFSLRATWNEDRHDNNHNASTICIFAYFNVRYIPSCFTFTA